MENKLFKGDLDAITSPYKGAKLIVDESIMPIEPKEGLDGDLRVTLMDKIDRVISLTTASNERGFEEGTDFFVKDGELFIPKNSQIRVIPWSEYNPPEGRFDCTLGGKLIFGNANDFQKIQYSVTYIPADDIFDGKYFPEISDKLENTRKILKERELKLAFFGDSITYGCNSSGLYEGYPPYVPIYPLLVAEKLRKNGCKVDYYNPSIGGKSSPWGRDTAKYYFDDFKPDLTVIAFGMNDGTGRLPVKDFIGNIKSIVETIRKSNPAAEFILVATTLPNPISTFVGFQTDYEKPLEELAAAENCAFLDMTELHRTIMTRKPYHDLTGNNINHPTDFLARLYAQGVLGLIGG